MSTDFILPKLGPEMDTGVLAEWLVGEGDLVELGQPLATVETDKVSTDIESPAAGRIQAMVEAGTDYDVGATLAVLVSDAGVPASTGDDESPREPPLASSGRGALAGAGAGGTSAPARLEDEEPRAADALAAPVPTALADRIARTEARRGEPFASPLARRVAAAHDVDLAEVRLNVASGPIRRRHVEAAIEARETAPAPMSERLSTMRRRIATRMRESLQETAQITDFREHDVGELIALRTAGVRWASALGFRVSFTDLFVRAAALALREVPELNVSLTDGDRLVRHDGIHVGVAVAVPNGLVVPVVRDADRLALADLHDRITSLVATARAGRLSLQELAGGTFTVTNIGSYGSHTATPILVQGQAGIMATGTFVSKPVLRGGTVVAGTTMSTSLTIDHRVVDGETAGRFQNVVGELLTDPERLL